MKLTKKQAEEARNRALDYEANMAVEGLFVSPEGREILDEIHARRMGYEEGVLHMLKSLRERGIIPAEPEEPVLAAE